MTVLSLMRWPLDCSRDRRAWSLFKIERVLSVRLRLRTKNERSTGLRGVRRNDLRPISPKIFLAIGARRLWTFSLLSLSHSTHSAHSLAPLPRSLRSLRELVRSARVHNRRAPIGSVLNFRAKGPKIVASYAPEPCRSFVFGPKPKPYAQHPFDFE